jgi:dihydroneopterin triphosphate diphosphatase
MRAPFQILAIPYKIINNIPYFCVMHRSDIDQWQFIAGGGEDRETPIETAKREVLEEAGHDVNRIIQLTSMCYIPTNIFPERHLKNWPPDTYVIPEYSFAFECDDDIFLSVEHIEYYWLIYDEARQILHWDSNKTALYELKSRLEKTKK